MTTATMNDAVTRHYAHAEPRGIPETAASQLWKAAGKYGVTIIFAALLSYWLQYLYTDLKSSWGITAGLTEKVVKVCSDSASAMTKLSDAIDRNTEELRRMRR